MGLQRTKTALVTGSSRRIGAAIVQKLFQEGYQVGIHCNHSLNEAHQFANQLNSQRANAAIVLQKDLSEPQSANILVEMFLDWANGIDLLVNNASLFIRSNCSDFAAEDQQQMFAVNVFSPFALSIAAFSHLAKNCGAIINITDIHGEKPLKDYAVYCQTKAALRMQTKVLAREFAPNVRVNAIAPGAIAWPEKDNCLTQQIKETIIAKTPLNCHGKPEYIAQALWSLLENPFITGQTLAVDGGRAIL